jgi:ribosomal protein L7/L12
VDRKLKRRLAIGGAVLVAFGAAGGAYAVTNNNDNGRDAYLNDLASRLHVSRDQLDSALKGAFEDRLDAAVKAGKLSQSEADAIKKKFDDVGAKVEIK